MPGLGERNGLRNHEAKGIDWSTVTQNLTDDLQLAPVARLLAHFTLSLPSVLVAEARARTVSISDTGDDTPDSPDAQFIEEFFESFGWKKTIDGISNKLFKRTKKAQKKAVSDCLMAWDLFHGMRLFKERCLKTPSFLTSMPNAARNVLRLIASKDKTRTGPRRNEYAKVRTRTIDSIAGIVILACLKHPNFLNDRSRTLLHTLSGYRFPSTGATVWKEMKLAPDLPILRDLLNKVREIPDFHEMRELRASGILSVTRHLAASLLGPSAYLLESPSYRMLLWNSIDIVVWDELLRQALDHVYPSELSVSPDPGTLEASLWLVSEFGYTVAAVDRRLRINEHLRKALRHDVLLYLESYAYRDHLMHAVNTFLLGLQLLSSGNDYLPLHLDPARPKARDLAFLRNWFLASLCHDFGYVANLFPATHRTMLEFPSRNISFAIEELQAAWSKQMSRINSGVAADAILLSEMDSRCDHGVFSYLHLRSVLRGLDADAPAQLPSIGHGRRFAARVGRLLCKEHKQALNAVLVHNLLDEPVDVDAAFLAALLVVCDELQDWNRPTFNQDSLTANVASLINFQAIGELQARRICEPLVFRNARVEEGRLVSSGRQPRVVLRYTDQNANVFDPLTRVLYKIYNLERIRGIHRINLTLEIWLRYLESDPSPYDTSQEVARISEIDILREFALVGEADYVSKDLFTLERDVAPGMPSRRPVAHRNAEMWPLAYGQRARKCDVIVLNFAQFPPVPRKDPIVRKAPWEFEEELWRFKLAYCRKKNVPCKFLIGDDDWSIEQIV
jgi:hypothetical protein